MRDEGEHIAQVACSMAAQRRPPERWVVVDDGSSDATVATVRALQSEIPFLRLLRAPQWGTAAGSDRLALAAEARAFIWALGQEGAERFDFIGKLDGDVLLDPDHYERLLEEMDRDPRLGIAGCWLEHLERGRWTPVKMPEHHVNGALKLYRAACYEAIGGVQPRLAWDTIDETYARMLGWRTRSFRDLHARHLRPSGSGGGQLRGRARHGECVWIVGYPLPVVIARAVRLLGANPPLLSGLAYLGGWLRAAIRRRGRVEDEAFIRFSRAEQRSRVRASVLGRRPVVWRRWRRPRA